MTTVQLIVNIYHQNEPEPYTVRDEQGHQVAGFKTIQQLDAWLKSCFGEFVSGPKEIEAGYYREIKIAAWAYQRISKQFTAKIAA